MDQLNEESALEFFNAVIWKLLEMGEDRSAELIDSLRTETYMANRTSKAEALEKRQGIYLIVEETVREFPLWNAIQILKKRPGLGVLGHVYTIVAFKSGEISSFKKINDLYDFVISKYMIHYKGVNEMDLHEAVRETRRSTSSVGRSVRHIKEDKPHLFHPNLIMKTKECEQEATETFGNSVVS